MDIFKDIKDDADFLKKIEEKRILLRPTWLEIDLDKLSSNYKHIKDFVGASVEIIAIVKADGYGNGAVSVSKTLEKDGVNYLAVATMDEALILRKTGVKATILLFGYFPKELSYYALKNNIIPTLFDYEGALELSDFLKKHYSKAKMRFHLKVDTGMGRIGVRIEDAYKTIKDILQFENLTLHGLYSHFPSADEDLEFTEKQVLLFKDLIKKLENDDIKIPLRHISNSAGIINAEDTIFNGVRPGILLYGLSPLKDSLKSLKNRDLSSIEPIMSLKSKIIFIKRVPEGESIGYGRTFITKRESVVGTVPIGYADGYSRALSNKAYCLVNGVRAPIIGRVSMDLLNIDLTDVPSKKVMDEVILIGNQGGKEITVDEIAKLMNSINYEVITVIGKRIPRIYIKNGRYSKIKYFNGGI